MLKSIIKTIGTYSIICSGVFFTDRVLFINQTAETVLHNNDLVQGCDNSIANALELLKSCTKHPYELITLL